MMRNRYILFLGVVAVLLGMCTSSFARYGGHGGKGHRGRHGSRRSGGFTVHTSGNILRIGQRNPDIKDPIGGNEGMIPAMHAKAFGGPRASAGMSDAIAEILMQRWAESLTNHQNRASQ
jgi:hypothetical protein